MLPYFPGFLPTGSVVFPALIVGGTVFFCIAVGLDYRMNIKFRVKDFKQPDQVEVPVLGPDNDVIAEEQSILNSENYGEG